MTNAFTQFGTRLAKNLVCWLQARWEHKLERYATVHHLTNC